VAPRRRPTMRCFPVRLKSKAMLLEVGSLYLLEVVELLTRQLASQEVQWVEFSKIDSDTICSMKKGSGYSRRSPGFGN
jgi:hypothetical protein